MDTPEFITWVGKVYDYKGYEIQKCKIKIEAYNIREKIVWGINKNGVTHFGYDTKKKAMLVIDELENETD